MAATSRGSESPTRQERAAAKLATFKAEQERLKHAAAARRADLSSGARRGGTTPVDRAWSAGRSGSGRQGQR